MRIALVVPGGVDRSAEYRVIPALLALIGRLSRQNDVQVFALNQEPTPGSWRLAGATVHNIGVPQTRIRAVRAILSAHRRKPFDLVHSIWSGAVGFVAVTAARLARVPCVIHIAGGEVVALPEIRYGGALRWRGRMREALVLRAASAVTSASAPVIESLSAIGIEAQRIPLGVDLAVWPPREPTRRDQTLPARLIHVASLNRVKDQTTLLRALAALRKRAVPFTMTVVGEDTLEGQIQRLSSSMGLAEAVSFAGFLPQRLLRALVESADLMLLSSRHETGPLAVLEAAVAGVPTVGTAVGHLAEWAPSAALAVPAGDWAAMADATQLLLNDEERRLQLACEALRRATTEDADFTVRAFQALYERLARAA